MDFYKVKFYLEVYLTASLLVMPVKAVCFAIAGQEMSMLSLIIWSVLMPINYFHNDVFISTLERLGWKRSQK
jgi:uncharacterized membrane protein